MEYVIVVIGGYESDLGKGDDGCSIRVFSDEDKAEEYKTSLINDHGYDYANLDGYEVQE